MDTSREARVLATFLPRGIQALHGARLPAGGPVEGCVLFADVSGFTALSERLQSLGREGAEELTRTLNRYFTDMIRILDEHGGDVVKFGGDAMTVVFAGDSGERAAACAARMQAAMAPFASFDTRAGACSLAMKIGIAHGLMFFGVVGTGERREVVLTGPPVDGCADAEHHAQKDWVVLHPGVPAVHTLPCYLPPHEGYFRLRLEDTPAQSVQAPEQPAPPDPDALAPYLPEGLAETLTQMAPEAVGGHRDVVVGFLSFANLDCLSDRAQLQALQDFTVRLEYHLDRFGGALNKLDMGDKGSKAVLLFGAPRALEDPAGAALHFARALFSDPDVPKGVWPLRLGLNRAVVFAGIVGSDTRREYSVMGDGVNLAARLMQKAAPGQILASASVMESARGWSGAALEPFAVKGKSEPVRAFADPRPDSDSGVRAAVDAGDAWMARPDLRAALETFLREGSGLALLEGEEGSGKSFLLDRASPGAGAARAVLSPFHVNLPWSAMQPLAERLGFSDAGKVQRDFGAMAPLFAPFLPTPVPETQESTALDPQARTQWLQTELVARMQQEPFQWIVDGAQWMDPLSAETLRSWLKSVHGPGKVILALREADAWSHPAAHFQLAPWDASAIGGLLAAAPPADRIAPDAAAVLETLTAGNPLRVTSLLRLAAARGLWKYDPATDHTVLREAELRDLLGEGHANLVLARVDALSAPARALVQKAAVIGAAFRSPVLAAIAGPEAAASMVEVLRAGILERRTGVYDLGFSSESVQRAVYDSLTFALRRELHAAVASHLENMEAPNLGAVATHKHLAESEDAAVWLFRAADAADAAYDRNGAIRYLNLAIATSPEPDPTWLLRRGRLRQQTGDAVGALEDLEEAARAAARTGDADTHLRSLQLASEVSLRRGALDRGNEMLGEVLEQAPVLGMHETLHAAGATKIFALALGGKVEEAEQFAHQFVSDYPDACMATMNLGNVLFMMGRIPEARQWFLRAREIAVRADSPTWEAGALVNLARTAITPDLQEAARLGEESLRLWERIYNVVGMIEAEINIGFAQVQSGRFADAVHHLEHSVRLTDLFGNPAQRSHARINLAEAYMELGEWDHAVRLLQECAPFLPSLPGVLAWDYWGACVRLNAFGPGGGLSVPSQPEEDPPHGQILNALYVRAEGGEAPELVTRHPGDDGDALDRFLHLGALPKGGVPALLQECAAEHRVLDQLRINFILARRGELAPQAHAAFVALADSTGSPWWSGRARSFR